MRLWALSEPRHLYRWTQQLHLPVQSTVCWYVLTTFPVLPTYCDYIIVKTFWVKLTAFTFFTMPEQENTVRWNRIPVPHIHVRGEECVFHLQITLLTPVAALLDGKVCIYL